MEEDCVSNFENEMEFYKNGAEYWEKVPATVDGMLGGFGFISKTDIAGSQDFLLSTYQKLNVSQEKTFALDCGAGIGRITKFLLSKHFDTVDLVEQNPNFLEAAKSFLKNCSNKIGEYYPLGLQDFNPMPQKYDVIWIQWVTGHLKNEDFIKFLQNCRKGLKSHGMLILKENVTSSENIEIDIEDSSVTRPRKELHKIFDQSKLKCIQEKLQTSMPRGLYPVYMFALVPKDS